MESMEIPFPQQQHSSNTHAQRPVSVSLTASDLAEENTMSWSAKSTFPKPSMALPELPTERGVVETVNLTQGSRFTSLGFYPPPAITTQGAPASVVFRRRTWRRMARWRDPRINVPGAKGSA